ncbi:MAG TPA: hypothetical protein VN222_01190, partial [Novosphingobium sp.]|nr:hypothetical protein [Novosphingobium sp.]
TGKGESGNQRISISHGNRNFDRRSAICKNPAAIFELNHDLCIPETHNAQNRFAKKHGCRSLAFFFQCHL